MGWVSQDISHFSGSERRFSIGFPCHRDREADCKSALQTVRIRAEHEISGSGGLGYLGDAVEVVQELGAALAADGEAMDQVFGHRESQGVVQILDQ